MLAPIRLTTILLWLAEAGLSPRAITVLSVLQWEIEALPRPRLSMAEFLARLTPTVPGFANLVRTGLGGRPGRSSGVSLVVMAYQRITVDADVMGGMPTIRGLRIPVATIVAMIADRMTPQEIVAELPDINEDDIAEALHYAAEAMRERSLPLLHSA